jgi:hypothetical protein
MSNQASSRAAPSTLSEVLRELIAATPIGILAASVRGATPRHAARPLGNALSAR